MPYTLEQEMVSRMVPLVNGGSVLNKPSYKPLLNDVHDAKNIH